MRRTVILFGLALAVGIVLGMLVERRLSAESEPVQRSVLLKTDLTGLEGKEALVMTVELAPGVETGKHYHPGHELAYVLEGTGVLEVEGKPPLTMQAGDGGYIAPGEVHNGKNGSPTAPLKLLVIWIAEKGQPPVVPVQ